MSQQQKPKPSNVRFAKSGMLGAVNEEHEKVRHAVLKSGIRQPDFVDCVKEGLLKIGETEKETVESRISDAVKELPTTKEVVNILTGLFNEAGIDQEEVIVTEENVELPKFNFHFSEDQYLLEIENYIRSTYEQHYASEDGEQTIASIIRCGDGVGFCKGNIRKLADRYRKKGTVADARKDLLKIAHYAVLLLYIHDYENKKKD